MVPEEDEMKYDFDLLDPTKIIPEELVPVTPIGRMVLNRNVDYFFGETEQVAFCPGHIVPGLDFTNDPLLQARLFSYTDTQLSRLGIRTSTRSQLTSRFVHSTITSVTVYISVLYIPVKPVMSRIRLIITGRLKLRLQHKAVALKVIRNVLMDTRSVSVANHSAITLVRPVFSTVARHHMSKSTLSMPMSLS